MNAVLNLGKYLYAIPLLVFAVFHFMNADGMAGMAFGSKILVYVTGVALAAASISIIIGKYDKLAAVLLALMLLIFVFVIHVPSVSGGNEAAMPNLLKDIMLAGAALMYAGHVAKDNSVIG